MCLISSKKDHIFPKQTKLTTYPTIIPLQTYHDQQPIPIKDNIRFYSNSYIKNTNSSKNISRLSNPRYQEKTRKHSKKYYPKNVIWRAIYWRYEKNWLNIQSINIYAI